MRVTVLGSLLSLCDVPRALINSLACWFCTGTLGLVLFHIAPVWMLGGCSAVNGKYEEERERQRQRETEAERQKQRQREDKTLLYKDKDLSTNRLFFFFFFFFFDKPVPDDKHSNTQRERERGRGRERERGIIFRGHWVSSTDAVTPTRCFHWFCFHVA